MKENIYVSKFSIVNINFVYPMQFDQDNPVNQLCVRGMQLEREGKPEAAAKLFSELIIIHLLEH